MKKKKIKFANYMIAFDIDSVKAMDYNDNDGVLVIVMEHKDFLISCKKEIAEQIINNFVVGEYGNEEYEEKLQPQNSILPFFPEMIKEEHQEEPKKAIPKFLKG